MDREKSKMRREGMGMEHGWEKREIPETSGKQETLQFHFEMSQVWGS